MTTPEGRHHGVSELTGEVACIYAFDIAYDMLRGDVTTLLGMPTRQFAASAGKHGPRQELFFRPMMVELPAVERMGPHGKVKVQRTVKVYPVGAISITARVPFEVKHIGDLKPYHEVRFETGLLDDEVRALAEQVLAELRPQCVRPVERVGESEQYTVFCLTGPMEHKQATEADQWLQKHRKEVAALLTQEADPNVLAHQEVEESTGMYLSYYKDDLVVVDWDAALVIERPENLNEVLHVIELANVQLEELQAYDGILDASLGMSYRDLGQRGSPGRREMLKNLRDIRLDLARLGDEVSNTTKFFGDWHMARVYRQVATRFHLGDWTGTIAQKIRTLDGLYETLKQDHVNRLMIIMEVSIIVLFIIDLIVLLIGPIGH